MARPKIRFNPGVLLDLTIPSNPEILCVVRGVITGAATLVGFAPKDCRSVARAVDEAIANVIRHGYRSRRNQPIEIICRRIQARIHQEDNKGLVVIVVDYGPAFDPTRLEPRSLNEVRPGGLGVHFIRDGMDAVTYKRLRRANCLRMVRYLPKLTSP